MKIDYISIYIFKFSCILFIYFILFFPIYFYLLEANYFIIL